MLCWDSNAITAPVVTVLALPAVHRLTSDAGSVQRQVNVPSCSWAASCGALNGRAGVKVTGR